MSGIVSGGVIGKASIGQSLVGLDADNPVFIAAQGKSGPKSTAQAVAIGSVTIKGDVLNADILGGFRVGGRYADGGIGKVIVQGNWTASNISAGVDDTGAPGNFVLPRDGFGRNDTLFVNDSTPEILARIASITIKGAVNGTAAGGDHFGITAQQIGKLKIGTHTTIFTTGPNAFDLNDDGHADFTAVDFA
jgi:hypothetical protein